MSAVPAVIPAQRASLVQKFASKYSLEPEKLMTTLKATAFKVKNAEATNEQMAALLVVADQYGLNPFTKEIFAFPDKQNGIVPVVGVDGWSRIINDHPQSDGLEFRQSEEMAELPDAQPCPKWMEVVIHRKDRSHPVVVREYLDEVYRPLGTYPDGNKMKPGPWQTHTKRFLRHKTLIQGARIAYGFAGIYDEDEAERIIEKDVTPQATEKPVVAMPQSKSAPAVIDQATGEVTQSAHAAQGTPAPANTEGGGAAGPMKPGQCNILRAKLKHNGLTELDLETAFPGKSLEPKEGRDLFAFSEFDAVQKWIIENAKG
jgi:phage recombination protein Bet